jgi:hypothetical protein
MWTENPALYEIAKQTCLSCGLPWTDPRTGKTYKPVKKSKVRKGKKSGKKQR